MISVLLYCRHSAHGQPLHLVATAAVRPLAVAASEAPKDGETIMSMGITVSVAAGARCLCDIGAHARSGPGCHGGAAVRASITCHSARRPLTRLNLDHRVTARERRSQQHRCDASGGGARGGI